MVLIANIFQPAVDTLAHGPSHKSPASHRARLLGVPAKLCVQLIDRIFEPPLNRPPGYDLPPEVAQLRKGRQFGEASIEDGSLPF